jgi:hypothetical protein
MRPPIAELLERAIDALNDIADADTAVPADALRQVAFDAVSEIEDALDASESPVEYHGGSDGAIYP